MTIFLYALISVLIISLVSFVGVFTLSIREQVLKKYVFILVSLALGALLGDAFIHLIPEAFEGMENDLFVSLAVIAGILIFLLFEKFLHWHHHAAGENHVEVIHPSGKMILLSDGVHNFLDGLIIGVSFIAGPEIGIATTLAVILHEIPQEIGDFGVLINAGYSKMKALFFNFLSALTAVMGVIVAFILGSASELLAIWLLPIAAGGFIYIAMADLVPEIHKHKSFAQGLLQFIAILVGICSMIMLLALE